MNGDTPVSTTVRHHMKGGTGGSPSGTTFRSCSSPRRRHGDEARALCPGVETAVVKTAVTAIAEMATWIAGVEQVDRTAVRMAADDPIRLFRTFITSVVL